MNYDKCFENYLKYVKCNTEGRIVDRGTVFGYTIIHYLCYTAFKIKWKPRFFVTWEIDCFQALRE